MVTKQVDDESFFNLFKDCKREDLENEDEEDTELLQERLEIDFDIISSLVEEVIPYSLEYYLDLNQDNFEDEEEEQLD
jgi:nucleosome assembly protein 1-like 1